MALADKGPAPYAPVKAMMTMIGLFRDKTIPLPITTTSIERAGVEASLARRTFAAMKQLDLLFDDGNPTPTMQKVRVAGTDSYQAVLADWLREAYKPIFLYVDPAADDVQKVTDQFRHYEPAGMRNRMVTLFLGLCAEAGLISQVPPMPRAKTTGVKVPVQPRSKKIERQRFRGGSNGNGNKKPAPARPPAAAVQGLDAARQRYVDLLLTKASEGDPSADLLDRIERALGIAPNNQEPPS